MGAYVPGSGRFFALFKRFSDYGHIESAKHGGVIGEAWSRCGEIWIWERSVSIVSERSAETEMIEMMKHKYCPQCGREVIQNPHSRVRRFCSDECRSRWNNSHPRPENWSTLRTQVCPQCGKEFTFRHEYGRERIYCSRACANKARKRKDST